MTVIRDENEVDVPRRFARLIIQSNFREGCPSRVRREKELRTIIGNDPILTKSNWAGDGKMVSLENATHSKRIVRFVLGAVGNLIVVRTKFFEPIAGSRCGSVIRRQTKDFSERIGLSLH